MKLPKLTKEIVKKIEEETKKEEERISKELGITGFQEIDRIIDTIRYEKKISVSYLQRNLSYSYPKATKVFNYLVDKYIEEDGKIIKEMICLHYGEEYEPGTKIIFLDVDGVLNCHSTEDCCGRYVGIEDKKVELLKQIVDATGAKIILVSTWKEEWYKNPKEKYKQDELANYLDDKLNAQGLKIIDKTDEYNSFGRGDGILEYLRYVESCGIEVDNFIILDDEMFDYKQTKLTSHLIRTTFNKNGLEEKHVRKAIEKLC